MDQTGGSRNECPPAKTGTGAAAIATAEANGGKGTSVPTHEAGPATVATPPPSDGTNCHHAKRQADFGPAPTSWATAGQPGIQTNGPHILGGGPGPYGASLRRHLNRRTALRPPCPWTWPSLCTTCICTPSSFCPAGLCPWSDSCPANLWACSPPSGVATPSCNGQVICRGDV